MKNSLSLIILVLIAQAIFAQKSNLNAARNSLATVKFDEAKAAIDLATVNAETLNDPKMWFTRGEVYHGIFESVFVNQLDLYKAIAGNSLEEAWKAYGKAYELGEAEMKAAGEKKNKYDKKVKEKYVPMKNHFIINGEKHFSAQDYNSALASFETALIIDSMKLEKEADTILNAIYFNAGLCANLAKQPQKALLYFNAAKNLKYKDNIAGNVAESYVALGDTAKAVTLLREEIEKTPNDLTLIFGLINIFLTSKDPQEAIVYLDKAIQSDPKNQTLYFAKGTIFDRKKDWVKAEEAYKAALAIKPDFFDALYNLGALYVQYANFIIKEAANIPMNQAAKYNEEVKKANDNFTKAIDPLEAALKIQKEKAIIETLLEIYIKQNNTAKADEMKTALKSLN